MTDNDHDDGPQWGEESGTGPEAGSKALLKGVFSRATRLTVGQGSKVETRIEEVHYYVEEDEEGELHVQPLSESDVPTGPSVQITREILLRDYTPEPEYYFSRTKPAIEGLVETIATAERHRRHHRTYSAEYEFKNALRVDEENIRATFGLGLTYLDQGDTNKGGVVFQRLVRLGEAFEPRHKHLFNEFGIKLREQGMHVAALKYYARASHLCGSDPHLAYNIARVYYEQGKHALATKFLIKALALKPDFTEGREFMDRLVKEQGQDQDALIDIRSYDGPKKKKKKRGKKKETHPDLAISMGDKKGGKAGRKKGLFFKRGAKRDDAGEFSFTMVKTEGKDGLGGQEDFEAARKIRDVRGKGDEEDGPA